MIIFEINSKYHIIKTKEGISMEKNLEHTLKKKNQWKGIISLILCILLITLFIMQNKDQRFFDALKPRCIINSYEDIQKCKKENHYVTVNTDTVYTTNYVYEENGITTAYFVDVDIDGMSLITIVGKKEAETTLNGDRPYHINGKLEKFQDQGMIDGYYGIIEDYLDSADEEISENDILNTVLPIQLNNYTGHRSSEFLAIFLYTILIGGSAYFTFKYFYLSKNIRKSKNLKYLTDQEIEKANQEYQGSKFTLKNKSVKVTDHFIFQTSATNIQVIKIEDIIWIYERSIRQYGFEINRPLIVTSIHKKEYVLPLDQLGKEKLLDTILDKNNDVLVGYTIENRKEYKKRITQKKAL